MKPFLLCDIFPHKEGKYLGKGNVLVVKGGKRPPERIKGVYDVFRCAICGEMFASKPKKELSV